MTKPFGRLPFSFALTLLIVASCSKNLQNHGSDGLDITELPSVALKNVVSSLNATSAASFVVGGDCSPVDETIDIQIDGIFKVNVDCSFGAFASTLDLRTPALTDGTHIVRVIARILVDGAMVTSEDSHTFTYSGGVVVTPATVAFTSSPGIGPTNIASYSLSGTCTPISSTGTPSNIVLEIVGNSSFVHMTAPCGAGTGATGAFHFGPIDLTPLALVDGDYSFKGTLTAGTSTAAAVATVHKATAPVLTLTVPTSGTITSSAYSIIGTCSPAGASIALVGTGSTSFSAPAATCSGGTYQFPNLDFSALPNGTANINLSLTNTFGSSTPVTLPLVLSKNITTTTMVAFGTQSIITKANKSSYTLAGTCDPAAGAVSITGISGTTFGPVNVTCSTAKTFSAPGNDFSLLPNGPVNLQATINGGSPNTVVIQKQVFSVSGPSTTLTSTTDNFNFPGYACYPNGVNVRLSGRNSTVITPVSAPCVLGGFLFSNVSLASLANGTLDFKFDILDTSGAVQDTANFSLTKNVTPQTNYTITMDTLQDITAANMGSDPTSGIPFYTVAGSCSPNSTANNIQVLVPGLSTVLTNCAAGRYSAHPAGLGGLANSSSIVITANVIDSGVVKATANQSAKKDILTLNLTDLTPITATNAADYSVLGTNCYPASANMDVSISSAAGGLVARATTTCQGDGNFQFSHVNLSGVNNGLLTALVNIHSNVSAAAINVSKTTTLNINPLSIAIDSLADITGLNVQTYAVTGSCRPAGQPLKLKINNVLEPVTFSCDSLGKFTTGALGTYLSQLPNSALPTGITFLVSATSQTDSSNTVTDSKTVAKNDPNAPISVVISVYSPTITNNITNSGTIFYKAVFERPVNRVSDGLTNYVVLAPDTFITATPILDPKTFLFEVHRGNAAVTGVKASFKLKAGFGTDVNNATIKTVESNEVSIDYDGIPATMDFAGTANVSASSTLAAQGACSETGSTITLTSKYPDIPSYVVGTATCGANHLWSITKATSSFLRANYLLDKTPFYLMGTITDLAGNVSTPIYNYNSASNAASNCVSTPGSLCYAGYNDYSTSRFKVSNDGNYVLFQTLRDYRNGDPRGLNSGLAFGQLVLFNVSTGTYKLVSRKADGSLLSYPITAYDISDDGQWVTWASNEAGIVSTDTNTKMDIFLYSTATDTNSIVPLYVKNTAAVTNEITGLAISHDGHHIAVATKIDVLSGSNQNFSNIFYLDFSAGTAAAQVDFRLVSRKNDNSTVATQSSYFPTISNDGKRIAFETAQNLSTVANEDANAKNDCYVWYNQGAATTDYRQLISSSTTTISSGQKAAANDDSTDCRITRNGNFVAFTSFATNIVSNTPAAPRVRRIYLRNLSSGTTFNKLVSVDSSGSPLTTNTELGGVSENGHRVLYFTQQGNVLNPNRSTNYTGNEAVVYSHDPNNFELGTNMIVSRNVQGEIVEAGVSTEMPTQYVGFYYSNFSGGYISGDGNRYFLRYQNPSFMPLPTEGFGAWFFLYRKADDAHDVNVGNAENYVTLPQ